MDIETEGTQLYYPIYLDAPMMISFLAALENGVAFEEAVERRSGARRSANTDLSAKAGLPSLFSLFRFDLKGQLGGALASEESEDLSLIRSHTEASLFNKLRWTMLASEILQVYEETELDTAEFMPGELIEIQGVIGKNTLEDLVGLYDRFRSFLNAIAEAKAGESPRNVSGGISEASTIGAPTTSAAAGQNKPNGFDSETAAIFEWIREDLRSADMTDVLLLAEGVKTRFVLTLSPDFGTGRTMDSLLGSRVKVIGKVTNISREGKPLSLIRRSLLDLMPEELKKQIFDNLLRKPGFQHLVSGIEIEPPYVQILPLAIFV